jgi:hypothetical protein
MIRRLAIPLSLCCGLAVCPLASAQRGFPSTTAVISQPSPSIFGQPVAFSATVTAHGATATPVPTGTVTFTSGANTLGSVALVALNGNGVAILTGVTTLPAGQPIITATYSGDKVVQPSFGTITQTVAAATPNITWVPNPDSIAVGAPLTAAQLDATASTKFTPNVPGTFTYKPSAGTVFNTPGLQTLTVTFTPTDGADFLPSASRTQINVIAFTLTGINPATATLNDPAKDVTFTGTGFTLTSVAQVNGNPIPTKVVQVLKATTLTGTIPATNFVTVSTLQLSVADPQIQGTTNALPLPVTPPPLHLVLTGPPTTPSRTEPSLNFQLTNPYPVRLDGILTLIFTPAAGLPDDPMIQFAGGGRTLPFFIPANSTTTPPVQFQAGTVTGSVTIALTVTAGGVNVTPDGLQPVIIQVPPAPPVLTSTTMLQRSGNQLTVVIHGFSNTRELSTANFDFTAASGSIKNPNIALPVTTLFTQWYSSQPSDQFGSEFTYTQSFILNDDASHIRSVSVTLVNSIGASTPGSAQ